MGPSINGKTKRGQCPVCSKPYRNDNMVECTQCKLWCCYECVNVSDEIENNENWKCPSCQIQVTQETIQKQPLCVTNDEINSISGTLPISENKKSLRRNSKGSLLESKKNSSINSSRIIRKLQLIQEERELLQKERELNREERRLIDEESCSSQQISDTEIDEVDTVANKLLSLEIENISERLNLKKADNESNSKVNQPPRENYDVFAVPRLQEKHHLITGKTLLGNNLTEQQYTARKSIPHDLPIFSGNSYDWPLFISSYERSTELCGFDNNENLMRLQKSLKGTARNAVSSFLILPECVPQIMYTLKILFGRPEQIIENYINTIRQQPPPKLEKLETVVEYALTIKNLCISMKAAKLEDYLNNPTLMHELVEKLPSQIKINWSSHRSTLKNSNGLGEFADWMFNMTTNLCTTLPSLVFTENHSQFRQKNRSNIHNPVAMPECKICNRKCRNASECSKFQNYSITEKWNMVKNLNLCRLCLKRHRFPCKYPVKCEKNQCQRKHHPLLHNDENDVSQEKTMQINKESEQITLSKEITMIQSSQNIRFRIVPVILKNGGKEVKTYAFLDEGSSVTLINENLSEELNLHGQQDQLCLQWTGDFKRLENNSKRVVVSIRGGFPGAKQFDYRPARTVSALSLPQQSLHAKELKENFFHLRNIPFASYKNVNPQILIGLDNWELALPLRVKEGQGIGEPIAAKCRLGWSVFALVSKPTSLDFSYHLCECTGTEIGNEKLHETVKEYFAIESLGIRSLKLITSREIERAKNIQRSTLSQEGKTYTIGLLWKYDNLKLPDSRGMALKRLECIEKRIRYNEELGKKMNEQIQDFIKKKYVRKLTKAELDQNYTKIWYLPIFAVFNPNKPGKFRIVWDAAASVQGISLNDVLLKGDDQLTSLLGVLLRFRERKIGFSADIKEMFLRVSIREEDQHAQRFLWRNGNSQNSLDTYIMTAMTFGATCSPSNAQFVKNTNAHKFITEYPRAVECILNNHYVDDLLDSADTEEEAVKITQQVARIHSEANFEIRNWHSNSKLLCYEMNSYNEDAATCLEIDTKRPIILPRECYLTNLIIAHYHNIFQHQNHETVVNEIRQKFYIPKLRRVLNKVKNNCQTCKIKFAEPAPPEMSPLPNCRLATYTAPFTFTGVDYFGPINVTVGRRLEKRWGSLFTCLTTRGVHLEVAHKLDADSFILCFQNFMNRRGRPRHIYCDRGTNFIATERILRKELEKVDYNHIAKAFISPEITFHFNSPLSPHMAGAWERLVKSVKVSLYESLPAKNPSDQLLQSCLIATENIVNSRPLTYLPLETEESEALTPNHFLVGSSNGDKPIGQFDDESKTLKFNYLYREQYANKCWRRFVAEYIPKLLLRTKWYKQVNPIKEGDIVIICDKNLPRCNWPKGRVIEIKKAPDGQVRRAKVQTTTGIFERPVVKLAILSVDKENEGTDTQMDCAVPGGNVKNE